MAKKRNRRGRHPLLDTAEANADLRFSPEESSLQALLGTATEDYKTDVRTVRGTTDVAIRGAKKSIPTLRKIYNQAATGVKAAQEDVEAAFNQAGVTPDNAFRLVAESEGTAYRQGMAREAAQARREAVRQANEARLGRVFGLGAARDRYNQTVGQLQQRAGDLRGERQSFLTSELGRLRSERADRKQQERTAYIQQNRDPDTGKLYPDAAEKNKPFEKASRDDWGQLRTKLARANDIAPTLKDLYSRKEAAQLMRSGIPKSDDGPGFKAIDDQLAIQVALDMAYRGSISKATRAELLRQGFKPKELAGVRYIANPKKRKKRAKWEQDKGDITGAVGGVLGLL